MAFQFAADSTLEPARRAPETLSSYLSRKTPPQFGKIGGIQMLLMWSGGLLLLEGSLQDDQRAVGSGNVSQAIGADTFGTYG